MSIDNTKNAEILLIEPSRLNKEIIINHINLAELSADYVEDEAAALVKLESCEYQLILCAAELKRSKGIEFTKQIREQIGESLPILLLTSSNDKKTLNEAFSCGITEVIQRNHLVELQSYLRGVQDLNTSDKQNIGKILCVEDSKPIAELIKCVLEDEGHEVTTLSSAEDALQLFENDNAFDMLITDILLEGKMTGIGLIRELRNNNTPWQSFPILAISGLDNVDQKLEALKIGASDFVSKPINFDELVVRTRNLITAKKLYSKVVAQEKELRKMAVTDPLTGLYNRHYLSDVGIKRVDEARRHQQSLSIIVVDIDHFKKVNDNYGHAAGDSVLKLVGNLLKKSCRSEDFAVRFGGEEFVLVLPHCQLEGAKAKAESIRENIKALKPEGIPITSSFGVASLEADINSLTFHQLFQLADEAVYYSKEHGRDQVNAAGEFSSSK